MTRKGNRSINLGHPRSADIARGRSASPFSKGTGLFPCPARPSSHTKVRKGSLSISIGCGFFLLLFPACADDRFPARQTPDPYPPFKKSPWFKRRPASHSRKLRSKAHEREAPLTAGDRASLLPGHLPERELRAPALRRPSFRAYVSISFHHVFLVLLYTFFHLKKGNLWRQMKKPRRMRGFSSY